MNVSFLLSLSDKFNSMLLRKKIVLLVLIPFFCAVSIAQTDTLFNQTDANNLKQGYWKKNYPNGKLMYKGFFKDNKPMGKMCRYFESGRLKAELYYDNKGEYSQARLLYENSELAAVGKYFNTLKDSIWVYYSYYDKSITAREAYMKGARHGMMIHYYNNGDLSEKMEWKNDKKSGTWEQYYKGNTLKLKTSYIDNKLQGAFLVNYEDGKPYVKGEYLNDMRNGKWTFYNEDGTIQKELIYMLGKTANEDKLDKEQQEFFKLIDENQGKFEEPDETNFLVPQGR
jgi:antitoxin component YwqK of YwqJK toxin-antitoxin module